MGLKENLRLATTLDDTRLLKMIVEILPPIDDVKAITFADAAKHLNYKIAELQTKLDE